MSSISSPDPTGLGAGRGEISLRSDELCLRSDSLCLRSAAFPCARRNYENVFEAIRFCGDDHFFEPDENVSFKVTEALPGSPEKLQVLAERLSKGLPLWHKDDRVDFENLPGSLAL